MRKHKTDGVQKKKIQLINANEDDDGGNGALVVV